jgi:hypothetical protein
VRYLPSKGDICQTGYFQGVYKPREFLFRPNQTVHLPTAYVTLHFNHNPAFLINDPVDELVGAAEEVVMSSTRVFFFVL